MAEIKPIRAWRYNDDLSKNISPLVSPLFDVVSDKQRKALYANPFNSIHLSVPSGNNPAKSAEHTINKWKRDRIILRDDQPGIYVYYQYFSLHGSDKKYCRKGFICNIRVYDWPENVLLRHENTMPGSVNDRITILESTKMNVSPTHGLYDDPEFILEEYMDQSMKSPLYETEDYQGVRDVLSVIHDPQIIAKFVQAIDKKQIILADGHHRYAGSLEYMKIKRQEPGHTGTEGYNFHMMYLTNMASDDLRVLPTHRVVKNLAHFDEENLIQQLQSYFDITPIVNNYEVNDIITGKQHTMGLILRNESYRISLKPGLEYEIPWKFPDMIKKLDLTILHYYIIEKTIGIPGKDQRKSEHIEFDRNFTDCLLKVTSGEAQMAVIVNEINMSDIKEVCFSGFTLPQKSTYFYPKAICGFIFHSINDEE